MRTLTLSHRLMLCLIAAALLACAPGPLLVPVTASPPREPTSTRALTPAPSPVPTSAVAGAVACPQSTIDAIEDLRAGYEFPDYFMEEDPEKRGGEFDANSYFTVLEHVAMEPGYVLDYVYRYDGMGGSPVLYAREANEPAYRTYAEYEQATGTPGAGSWLDHVAADGTPAGYLELVILAVMADQFYLFWHANYNDTQIACNQPMIENIVSAIENTDFGQTFTADQAADARALDTTPRVEIEGDEARVAVVLFTKWGGFYRATFTIQHDFPHKIVRANSETLVPYDCGIMF